MKLAAGRVVDMLAQRRTNKRITKDAAISRLMELESLSLGIEGKRALAGPGRPRGDRPAAEGLRLPRPHPPGKEQRKRLEPDRLEAAGEAVAA